MSNIESILVETTTLCATRENILVVSLLNLSNKSKDSLQKLVLNLIKNLVLTLAANFNNKTEYFWF